jgi:prophage regulatory protein
MTKNKQATLPDVGFIRLPKVLEVYPVGRSTWLEGVKAGTYPPAHRLAKRITAWRVSDIRKLIGE